MSRDEQLITDYLLGELPGPARRAVEERAAVDPAFAEALESARAVVEGLETMPAEGWAPPGPPPLAPLPGLGAPRRWRPGAWDRDRRPAFALAVVGLAAIVAGGLWWSARDAGGGQGPPLALAPLGAAAPAARGEARTLEGGDALALRVRGLDASAPGSFYELWLLDDPERLVSLGSFRVAEGGAADIRVPLPVPVTAFAYLDVSVEADDGNPAHSGDSVLRGAVG